MRAVPVPEPILERPVMREEVLVVLALSLLASAVYALLNLLEGPVRGATVASVPQVGLDRQLVDFAFGLAPVWLVFHLLRRSGERAGTIGMTPPVRGDDWLHGLALFAVVGAGGLLLYLGAVELGVNRFVVPVPPMGHWWTVPVIVLTALGAALLEEIVVLGYLVTRLRQLAWRPEAALGASALLRGSYHLYQGWGGFLGNVALGVIFGIPFLRRGRLWPMVIAHFLLDVSAGVGYLLFKEHLPG